MEIRLRFRRIRIRFCYLLEVPSDNLETSKPHFLRTLHHHFIVHGQLLFAIRIEARVMLVLCLNFV